MNNFSFSHVAKWYIFPDKVLDKDEITEGQFCGIVIQHQLDRTLWIRILLYLLKEGWVTEVLESWTPDNISYLVKEKKKTLRLLEFVSFSLWISLPFFFILCGWIGSWSHMKDYMVSIFMWMLSIYSICSEFYQLTRFTQTKNWQLSVL